VSREDLVALVGGLVTLVGGGEAGVDAILEGDTAARRASGDALVGGVVAFVTVAASVLEVLETGPGFPAGGRVGGVSGLSGASGAKGTIRIDDRIRTPTAKVVCNTLFTSGIG